MLSLAELLKIWSTNNTNPKAHLYIFADSCYSGSWCDRLATMKSNNVSVFAACLSEQTAVSDSNVGGLFFNCILNIDKAYLEGAIQFLFHKQQPYYANAMEKPV